MTDDSFLVTEKKYVEEVTKCRSSFLVTEKKYIEELLRIFLGFSLIAIIG